jgi:hypothetical protein
VQLPIRSNSTANVGGGKFWKGRTNEKGRHGRHTASPVQMGKGDCEVTESKLVSFTSSTTRLGLDLGRVCRSLVLLGVGAVIAAAYLPGSVNPDALDIWDQAVTNVYTDWHSPVFAWLWGISNLPIEAVFLLTLAVMIVAVHLILVRWLRPWIAVAGTAGVMMFPATIGWMGHVGKDEWFAAAFLLGTALIARAGTENRVRLRRALMFGVLLCFWCAIAARKNALLPVGAALLVAWPVPETVFGRLSARPFLRRVLASTAVLVVLMGSVTAVSSAIVRPRATHPEASTYLFDLAGISLHEQRMLFPREVLASGTTLSDIDRAFNVKEGDGYFFGAGTPVTTFLSPPQVTVLQQKWLAAVLAYPDAYLRTRISYSWALLGVSAPHPLGSVNDPGSLPSDFRRDLPLADRTFESLHQHVFNLLVKVEQRNLFRGWFFVLVLIVGSLVAGIRRVAEARVLLVGGVLSLAGLAVAGISPTFRYSWFTAFCGLIAAALALQRIPGLGRPDPPLGLDSEATNHNASLEPKESMLLVASDSAEMDVVPEDQRVVRRSRQT